MTITTRKTAIRDLHRGDRIAYGSRQYTVVQNTPEPNGFYTLRIQQYGKPVRTIREALPDYKMLRITTAA